MAHTFDPAKSDRLEDVGRYRYCSRDELVDLLDVDGREVAADVGSGTGFYAADVAPHVGRLYGVDVQPRMHEKFLAKGTPENVELVTAEAADFPLADGALDVTYSTMTFHEFAGTGALAELGRALRPGGRLVAVDWSAEGEGESGPALGERHDAASAADLAETAGFVVDVARERPETFVLAADLPE